MKRSASQCYYLSGPGLDGTLDADRCEQEPTTQVRFEGDSRWSGYCDEHASIVRRAFLLGEEKPMPRKRKKAA